MPLVNWIRWQNVVDFIVLSVAFYLVLIWAKRRRLMGWALRFDHHELGVRRGLSRGNRPARTPVPS